MIRNTIDYGIDLGTTNSAVAVLNGVTTEIIKNNQDADITPSAVYIDKREQLYVGARAKERIVSFPSDAFVEFKRQMETDSTFSFQQAGRRMRPEELSAEVLKALRADVQNKRQEDITAAVITVPAAFEQRQCAATRKAAELAGFTVSPLLQEPVAAALAYGFQVESEKQFWLVYDFGGGTFDAAIIKAEDGSIQVVNHGGDNFLGGSDMDWAIIDQLVVPAVLKEHRLAQFERGNAQWSKNFAKIKRSVELAKIELSRSETAFLDDCLLKDADDEELEFEFQLTRRELVRVAEPIIRRSAEIAQRVLREKQLQAADLAKVIMVGGPTKAAYFREIVQDALGSELDVSMDPLTVVARGAAVFAGTQRLKAGAAVKPARGSYTVELNYEPVGPDPDPTVRGTVRGSDGTSVENFSLELINERSRWRSGRQTLRADGKFKARLLAERGDRNNFLIELTNPTGTLQPATPASLSYTIGMSITEQIVIHSIGVGTLDNTVKEFFKKGAPLPARVTYPFRAAQGLKAGRADDVLRIPVGEGENARADRNRVLGEIQLNGGQVRRDIQAGREIEVTLNYDESRQITITAYVQDLDQEFCVTLAHEECTATAEALDRDQEEQLSRLDALRRRLASNDDPEARSLLAELERSGLLGNVAREVAAARADRGAAGAAESRLLEVKIKLDGVEDALSWPELLASARTAIATLQERLADYNGDRTPGTRAIRECEAAIQSRRAEHLRTRVAEIDELANEILVAQPTFWVGYFQWLQERSGQFQDPARAERLVNHGYQCMERNDVTGLRSICVQLNDLLPKEERAKVKRVGIDSHVVR